MVTEDESIGSLALLRTARERLPDTMLPNRIEQVPELPLTQSSKLDERRLLSEAGLPPLRTGRGITVSVP